MEFIAWEKLIAVYGPLGLGWPIAIWAIVKLVKAQDSLRDTLMENATALTRLATLIEAGRRE